VKKSLLFVLLLLVACGREAPQDLTVTLTADTYEGQAPLPVNFTAAVPEGGNEVGYTWDFGTGDTVQGSSSRPYTFREAGTFEVTVEATKDGASATDTVTVTVTEPQVVPDNQVPVVELAASATTGRAPLEVTFSANALDADGDTLLYSWNFGDGTTTTAEGDARQTHTFAEGGSYVAAVTVSDGKGGIDQADLQIAVADPDVAVPPTEPPPTLNDNEPPTVALSATTSGGSAPLTVSFSAEASDPEGDPLTYAWTFGNGERAEGNTSRTVTYREPGDYTAVVTVSDGLAQEEARFRVSVTEPAEPPAENTPPTVSLTATPIEGSTPLRVAFSAEASDDEDDADNLSYLWDFGDGTIAGGSSASHTYREAGDYSASVTVSDGDGGKTREEVTITATPGPGEEPEPAPDVPFYGEWAWAARAPDGKTFEGFLSISQRSPEPDPEFAESFVEGGMGVWTHCADGVDACGAPTGLGYIDVVDFGQGEQFDIVFVNEATGSTTMVAFDDDDRLGNEVDGAPTLQGGGAWIYEDGSSDDLSFAMVKTGSEPEIAMNAALDTLSTQRNRSR